ncbi:hypothetical protein [Photobacterium profundum]|uniref:Uncharacterized protein n=1 Tax=Photobacterium profundum (strain SS9) TaxID=298386 RepID=Q6LS98_PHOPR|nr:hypothetical protein [Photobacterium profundum]CAG19828.1 hypothetical protein PBPRA1417 [Photobacterium profundum SS9]
MFSLLLAIAAIIGFFAIILFVLFGQITVRKLRKNPKTKEALGSELVSGWDILNVAKAIALPRAWSKRFENSPLSFMYANSTLVLKHTNKLDRFLGGVFFLCWMVSGLMFFSLMLLDLLGVFTN